MPTFSQGYAFLTSAQGFTATVGSSTTGSWASGIGNPAGSLQLIRAVKAATSATSNWSVTGTFTSLGIPSGATIIAILAPGMDWQCSSWTSAGTGGFSGPATLTFGATAVTLSNQVNFTGSGAAFATVTGAGASNLSWSPTGTFTISVTGILANANTTGSSVTLNQDNLDFTIQYTVQQFSDMFARVESMGSLYTHSPIRIEALSNPLPSKPLDFLSSQRQDSNAFLEFVQTKSSDTAVRLEELFSVASDQSAPVSVLYGVSNDSGPRFEDISKGNFDVKPFIEVLASNNLSIIDNQPYEYLSAQRVDYEDFVENTGNLSINSIPRLEDLSGSAAVSNDFTLPIEFYSNFISNSTGLAEFLSLRNYDRVNPVEAGISVQGDFIPRIEYTAISTTFSGDSKLLLESIVSAKNDNLVRSEVLTSSENDSTAVIEDLGGNLSHALNPIEVLNSQLIDQSNRLTFTATKAFDNTVSLSFLFSQVGHSPPPMETISAGLTSIFGDSLLPIEFLHTTPGSKPFEYLSSSANDSLIIFEYTLASQHFQSKDSPGLLEWVQPVIGSFPADILLPIEFLHTTPGSKPFEYLSQGSSDSLLSVEVGSVIKYVLSVDPGLRLEILKSQVANLPGTPPLVPSFHLVRRIIQQPDGTYVRRLLFTKVILPPGGAFLEFSSKYILDNSYPIESLAHGRSGGTIDPETDRLASFEFLSTKRLDYKTYNEYPTNAIIDRKFYSEYNAIVSPFISALYNLPIEVKASALSDTGEAVIYYSILADESGNPILSSAGQPIILSGQIGAPQAVTAAPNTSQYYYLVSYPDGTFVITTDGQFVIVNSILVPLYSGSGIEFTTPARIDIKLTLEKLFSQRSDSISRPEFSGLGQASITSVFYLESLLRGKADPGSPIENYGTRASDTQAVSEFTARRQYDISSPQLEWLWSLRKDDLGLIDNTGGILLSADQLLISEFVSTRARDQGLPITLLGTNRRFDANSPIESLFTIKTDNLPTSELVSFQNRDWPLLITYLSRRPVDTIGNIESRSVNAIDNRLLSEFVSASNVDNRALSEILSYQSRHSLVPTEFSGFIASISDSLLCTEFYARQLQHLNPLTLEALNIGSNNTPGLVDLLASSYRDSPASVDLLAAKLSDARVLLEPFVITTMRIDNGIPIEYSSALSLDQVLRVDSLIGTATDFTFSLSAAFSSYGRIPGLLEVLTQQGRADIIAPIDVLPSIRSDMNIRLSLLLPLQRHIVLPIETASLRFTTDFVTPIESISSQLTHNKLYSEWGGALAVAIDSAVLLETLFSQRNDYNAVIEYVNATIQRTVDTNLLFEFNANTISDALGLIDALMAMPVGDNNIEIEFNGVPLVTLLSSTGRLTTSVKIRIVKA